MPRVSLRSCGLLRGFEAKTPFAYSRPPLASPDGFGRLGGSFVGPDFEGTVVIVYTVPGLGPPGLSDTPVVAESVETPLPVEAFELTRLSTAPPAFVPEFNAPVPVDCPPVGAAVETPLPVEAFELTRLFTEPPAFVPEAGAPAPIDCPLPGEAVETPPPVEAFELTRLSTAPPAFVPVPTPDEAPGETPDLAAGPPGEAPTEPPCEPGPAEDSPPTRWASAKEQAGASTQKSAAVANFMAVLPGVGNPNQQREQFECSGKPRKVLTFFHARRSGAGGCASTFPMNVGTAQAGTSLGQGQPNQQESFNPCAMPFWPITPKPKSRPGRRKKMPH